jgi:chromosome segregation ATPase
MTSLIKKKIFVLILSAVILTEKVQSRDLQNNAKYLDLKNVLPELLKLDDVRHRVSRQFKDASFVGGEDDQQDSNDASIAMSLVDALQKWADALEAQISMMRGEVLGLKTSNRELLDQVSNLQVDKDQLQIGVDSCHTDLTSLRGETFNIKDDLRVMSSSFSDFIDHFDSHSQLVKANHSVLHDSIVSLNGSHVVLTNQISVWRLEHVTNKNTTEVAVGKVTEAIRTMSKEVNANKNRITQVTADTKALSANVQLILYNASVALFNDVEDLRSQDEAFAIDFNSVRKSVELIQGKYEDINSDTRMLKEQVLASLEAIQTEVEASYGAAEATMKPVMTSMNMSLYATIGNLEATISHLGQDNKDIRQDVFRLEATTSNNAVSLMIQANMSESLQDQVLTVANSVTILKGTSDDLTLATSTMSLSLSSLIETASYNSSLLQRGFLGLERHFIEMKRKIFETQLQVGNINDSLQSIGDLRTEVLAIGQAMANTTFLVSDRFEDVMANNIALQNSLNTLWNTTNHLEAKLNKIHTNHTFVTGIIKSSFTDILTRFEDVEYRVKKSSNRTLMLESGLTGLMNYTLELDDTMTAMTLNMSKVNSSMTLAFSKAEHKINKSYELYELQGERIIDNANLIHNNVTLLSLAANILEAELSRMSSNYNNLKNTINRYASSTGRVEVNVQKLVSETIYVKNELDSLRFDMASVKAESTGVNVFVTSIQNHIAALTSNMTSVTYNVSMIMTDLDAVQDQMEDMTEDIEGLKTNVTMTLTSIGNAGNMYQAMDSNMATMKNNVVGLGNYINNINSDLGAMLTSFDTYVKTMSSDIG